MRIQKSVIKKKERQGGKELNDMHCILEKSKGISNIVKIFFPSLKQHSICIGLSKGNNKDAIWELK